MKTSIFSIISVFLIASHLFAQKLTQLTSATDFEKLAKDLSLVRPLLNKNNVKYEEAAELEASLAALRSDISLDILTRLPEGAGKITPEWQAYIDRLGKVIEPFEKEIIEGACRTVSDDLPQGAQFKRVGTYLSQLLDFAKPDEELDQELRNNIEKFPRARWEIYRKLFELRMLTLDDVNDMELIGRQITDEKEKVRWAEEVSFYGSVAALDFVESILAEPYVDSAEIDNESYVSYIPAKRCIDSLGAKAKKLLPLIKKRRAEVFECYQKRFGLGLAEAGIRLFNNMENTIETNRVIYGAASNNSGVLYPPTLSINAVKKTQGVLETPNEYQSQTSNIQINIPKNQAAVATNRSKIPLFVALILFLVSATYYLMKKKM